VEVLQDHDERPVPGDDLQEPAQRPVRVLGRAAALPEPEHLADPLHDPGGAVDAGDHRRKAATGRFRIRGIEPGRFGDDLDHRVVGDPTIGRAAAAQHRRSLLDRLEQRLDESGLSHSRRTEEGHQLAGAVFGAPPERGGEQGQLELPTHHRHGQVDAASHPWTEELQTVGVDGSLLALEDQRSQLLDVGGLPDQAMGRLAQQDLARPSRLLQMGDDVHHLAGELAGTVRPGHHLPALDSHPDGQADGRVMFELLVESHHPIA
jgi:hypothetical protein